MPALRHLAVGAATLLLLGSSACDADLLGVRNGRLNLLLTDAPGDVAAAVVTIERIYLQADSSQQGSRVDLLETPVTVDLLTLQDSLLAVLDSVELPQGTYRQLRFVISGGYVSVVGADTTTRDVYASSPDYPGLPAGTLVRGTLQMPSFAQSGLKVQLPGDALQIGGDGAVTLVVDFDVAQSFGRAAGHSGRWVMHPVITSAHRDGP